MENKALGKGLSALIPEKAEPSKEAVTYLTLDKIQNNSLQPRSNYDEEKLGELRASIQEKGVLQPILVRTFGQGYEVVAGERRLKAARSLGLKEIPAIIKTVTDQESLVIALIENIQREELNPVEEAEAYKKLIEEFGYTQETVAQYVGKDRSTVSNLLRLLKLPDEIKKSLYDGKLSVGHARTLLAVDSLIKQKELYELTIKQGLSVRELEGLINSGKKEVLKKSKVATPAAPEIVALEENLQKFFGTKVHVLPRGKKGKIVIDYYSMEDLTRIIEVLKK